MQTVTYKGRKLTPIENPCDAKQRNVRFARSLVLPAGTVVGEITGAGANQNEKQTVTVTGTPTGGTFTLTFDGQTTAAIAYNATAAAVQAALELLSNIGAGNVIVTGGPGPGTPWVVEFLGEFANLNVPQMTDNDAGLTGGTSPAVTVTTTQAGSGKGAFAAYGNGNSDGTEVAKGILVYDIATDGYGNVYFGSQAGSEHDAFGETAPIYISGEFLTSELTGLDAAAVTDLGRLAQGTLAAGILRIG